MNEHLLAQHDQPSSGRAHADDPGLITEGLPEDRVGDGLVLDTKARCKHDPTTYRAPYHRETLGQVEIEELLRGGRNQHTWVSGRRESNTDPVLKNFGGVQWCPRSAQRGRLEKAPARLNQPEKCSSRGLG